MIDFYSHIKWSIPSGSISSVENAQILGSGTFARSLIIASEGQNFLYRQFRCSGTFASFSEILDRNQITLSSAVLNLRMIFSLGKVYSVMGSVEAIIVFCWIWAIPTNYYFRFMLFHLSFAMDIVFLWNALSRSCYVH